MTAQLHAQTILDRLTSSGAPALTVYDGKVNGLPPYVLVYFTVVTAEAELEMGVVDLTFDSDVMVVRAYCHCVATDGRTSRALTNRVRTALLNWQPVIAGRTAWPIRHEDSSMPDRDETTGSDYFDVTDVYRLKTIPS